MNTHNENLWHYSDGSASFGPLTSSTIRQLIAAKVILPDFTLRREGEETSLPISEVDLDAPPTKKVDPAEPLKQATAPPPPPVDTTEAVYHLTRNGTNSGPYRACDLRVMILGREVTATDLVWKDGMTDWVNVESVAELRTSGSPPPPPVSSAAVAPQPGGNPFQRYFLSVFKNYALFTGRATRKEYWMFVLFSFTVMIALAIVDAMLGGGPLEGLYVLGSLIPSVAIGVRRMQDTDHNGWWLFCPIVNLIFAVQEGTKGTNRFGPAPESSSR